MMETETEGEIATILKQDGTWARIGERFRAPAQSLWRMRPLSLSLLLIPLIVCIGLIVASLSVVPFTEGQGIYEEAFAITYALWYNGDMELADLERAEVPLLMVREAIMAAPGIEDELEWQIGQFVDMTLMGPEKALTVEILGRLASANLELLQERRKHLMILTMDGIIDGVAQAGADERYGAEGVQ